MLTSVSSSAETTGGDNDCDLEYGTVYAYDKSMLVKGAQLE